MTQNKLRVGEIRPSQLMFNYGVGAVLDLPKISVIVTGLEDWPTNPQYVQPIVEERLLMAVSYKLPTVERLLTPPLIRDGGGPVDPFDITARIGVPVATFPRWMLCPRCRTLAPLKSGLFKLKENFYHPDRIAYRHDSCPKAKKPPEVVPARFLVACENGHLDDFPWNEYVHQERLCASPMLRLLEYSPSGEARDLFVVCQTCDSKRPLAAAFNPSKRSELPTCRGRRPHLRDFAEKGCEHPMRPILLGASNTWFPTVLSTLAIPVESGKLAKLVDEQWAILHKVKGVMVLEFLRDSGQLGELSEYNDEKIWQAIEERKAKETGESSSSSGPPDIKEPEWRIFSQFNPQLNSPDFRLQPVAAPQKYKNLIEQVILVERMREVRAIIGFTRLDTVGELSDPDQGMAVDPAPLTRQPPTWVPANEVRGEGIFLKFNEQKLNEWLEQAAVKKRASQFFAAHRKWRQARGIQPEDEGFPGMRYILIHTFAHALLRQLALECGYSSASIRERIYARSSEEDGGPMAGLLLYTSAPDSEGTLGGLVSLGQPDTLQRHISQALEATRLCASDPLCAERPPSQQGRTLHAAACHACTFAPETSCERGNKYLDRATLVQTVEDEGIAFF